MIKLAPPNEKNFTNNRHSTQKLKIINLTYLLNDMKAGN